MNLDTLNSKYKVVSKYFTGKAVMDESLDDFKEKKSFKVKNVQAPTVKPKVKKVKKVKGQKDIRTALKQKKNELITYSKHFDAECKRSGVDVDSEQLQIAIALSKSLQTSESSEKLSDCSKSLTSQQRTGLIRSTLVEYGFKIPEKPNASRKTKKRRKPYKLLLTSKEEKQQIITDRYSQLLFELNNSSNTSVEEDLLIPNLFIYNMSTNMEYKDIKDNSIFYVENLIEEAPNTAGSLLKNWSDIPGRPVSPAVNKSELLFSDIECSQEEMDIVFSGTLKSTKAILNKHNLLKDRESSFNCSIVEQSIEKTTVEPDLILIGESTSPVLSREVDVCHTDCSGKEKQFLMAGIDVEEKNLSVLKQPSRSLSPDLFDDEDDTVTEIPSDTITEIVTELPSNITKDEIEMDLTECVNVVCHKNNDSKKYVKKHSSPLSKPLNATKRNSNYFMETTECVSHENDSKIEYNKPVSQVSQLVDMTKRKSNDFMEITECVGSSSNGVLDKIDEHVDVISCPESGRSEAHLFQSKLNPNNECIDLTADCKKDIENKNKDKCENEIMIGGSKRETDHVDLTEHNESLVVDNRSANADHVEHMDLTQSSNSSTDDPLPFVHISGKENVVETSLEDTIILNENEYIETNSTVINTENENISMQRKSPSEITTENETDDKLDKCVATEIHTECALSLVSKKILVESNEVQTIDLDEIDEAVGTVDGNIDLTQSSNSNEATNINDASNHLNSSGLGKKDDVSVDYDEALENMNSFPYYIHDENYDNSIDLNMQTPDNARYSNSKPSVLGLPDNELISPSKTTNVEDNFDFGGISVIDNLPSFSRKSRNTLNSIYNGSMSDSLPLVHVKGKTPEKPRSQLEDIPDTVPNCSPIGNLSKTNEKPNNVRVQTPQTKVNRHVNIETPEQSEYIVKTDNVTPMLDYASMTTPERNRELDKYGLKPFKRKRAIQLLTHLYNQTHPYVESTDELTSPSKKRKQENQPQPSPLKSSSSTSSEKSKSPRKPLKSPRKHSDSPKKRAEDSGSLNESDKENELFSITTEVPAIRNIECDEDDWVFQKREKAKVHSCRVPLHIAFHNYVSCRLRLHEAILRYEPVDIDAVHKGLAASGHRYDPKDLLKFMDKKCITVKTADNVKNKR